MKQEPTPRTRSSVILLKWLRSMFRRHTICMPQPGWTQTENGFIYTPPKAGSDFVMRHPFRFSRASSPDGAFNGVYVQFGQAGEITPTIEGGVDPLSSTLSDNFLETWQDSETAGIGAIVIDFTVSNDDEWDMTVESCTLRWYDTVAGVPADGTGTDPRHVYKIIGYDSPVSGPQNLYFTNLGLLREGQIDEMCFLYGL